MSELPKGETMTQQEIDRLALESYERLTSGSKNSNTCLFYREGFEAGFRKAQELGISRVSQLLILNREQANSANRLLDSMEQVIRHQKYRRCLAMAKWCASRSASWCFDPADDELHKSDFYEKWKLRWRELAEKFKEGK